MDKTELAKRLVSDVSDASMSRAAREELATILLATTADNKLLLNGYVTEVLVAKIEELVRGGIVVEASHEGPR